MSAPNRNPNPGLRAGAGEVRHTGASRDGRRSMNYGKLLRQFDEEKEEPSKEGASGIVNTLINRRLVQH